MDFPQRITGLSTEAVGDGLAVLDAERKQSYVLNATSALVFQHCDGQTSPEQLAEILRQKFNLRQAEAEHLTQARPGGARDRPVCWSPPPSIRPRSPAVRR